jgi:hypothetical protein
MVVHFWLLSHRTESDEPLRRKHEQGKSRHKDQLPVWVKTRCVTSCQKREFRFPHVGGAPQARRGRRLMLPARYRMVRPLSVGVSRSTSSSFAARTLVWGPGMATLLAQPPGPLRNLFINALMPGFPARFIAAATLALLVLISGDSPGDMWPDRQASRG